MTRPTPVPVSIIDNLWYQKLNTNFQQILDAPFPVFQLISEGGGGASNFTPIINATRITESPPYTFTNTGGAATDAYVYSTEVFSGSCYVALNVGNNRANERLGVRFGPTPGPTDFANDIIIYLSTSNNWNVYKLGSLEASGTGVTTGDLFEYTYSGTLFEIKLNGLVIWSDTVTAGQDCSFTSGLNNLNNSISDVQAYLEKPGAGGFEQDARVFNNCIGVFDGTLYVSDGTAWNRAPQSLLSVLADLVPGVATIQDIQDAFNALLADMRTKNWLT